MTRFVIRFEKSLRAWGAPEFETVFRQELAVLTHAQLPLQQGLSGGSHVTDLPVTPINIRAEDDGACIRVTTGLFYQGVIGGCSCAEDAAQAGFSNEYCEVQLDIDKTTAAIRIALTS